VSAVQGDRAGPRVPASGTPFLARLFEAARRFLGGAPAVALAAAFVWGILSMLLSPCHLASIPLVVAAGTSTGLVQRWLDWHGRSRGAVWLKRACGALVAVGGLYVLYTAR